MAVCSVLMKDCEAAVGVSEAAYELRVSSGCEVHEYGSAYSCVVCALWGYDGVVGSGECYVSCVMACWASSDCYEVGFY